jgi:hypothetical protein
MHTMMVNLGFSMAKMILNGLCIYNEYIYKPFNKHIYKPLVYILNIQERCDEIRIIKDGVIIYSFETMDDFIKNNPINFIKDKHNDDSGPEDHDNNSGVGQDKDEDIPKDDKQTIDTVIDADLTHKSTDFHTNKQSDEDTEDSGDDEDHDDDDDLILDPREYDFLVQTLYYENIQKYERHSVCFKYETFRKSDSKKIYTNDELMSHVSKRKLIGANLHMNSKKYDID